jgi:small conductance mechanosensitive channel
MESIKIFFTQTLPTMGLNLLPKLIFAIVILVVGFKVVNLILKRMEQHDTDSHRIVRKFLRLILSIALKTILILTAANTVGIPITSLVAVLASAGVAVALALQDSLSNIASGVFLVVNQAYEIGDFIEANGVSGTVQEVKLFQTVLLTPDNRRVLIPNSSVAASTLINYSSEDTRRVDFEVGVSYDSNVDQVKSILVAIAQNHPSVLQDPAPMARLANFGDSSIDFTFRVWCKSEDYWKVKFDLNEEIIRVLNEQHIEIPYPQMDLHISSIKKP